MGNDKAATCAKVGTLPEEYSDLLPKKVPIVERPATSMFPFQSIGPGDATWYFPIGLGKTNPTGVFIPQGYAYPSKVDVILYFHGNKDSAFSTINQYWKGDYRKITLREDLNASGKSAILIAPTMGYYPGHGLSGNPDLGVFGAPGGGDCFLDHVMAWLGKYDDHYSGPKITPQVGKVVLAGHSGGGSPIIMQMESMKARVCEIWCFDTVYGPASTWVNFAQQNPTKPITFYHAIQSLDALKAIKNLKASTEKKLKIKLDSMQFVDAGGGHFPALTNNFRAHLSKSTCFSKR